MTAEILCLTAALGLAVGSFLNVCIFRIPAGESVVWGRSHCMACGHAIRWYDLVPVVSFLALRGRCRDCGARISARYPLVEAANAALWVLCALRFGVTFRGCASAAAVSVLIVAAGIDRDTGLLYDRFWMILAALGAASFFFVDPPSALSRVVGALCVSLPMLALALACGGFGGGDVKLCAACGLLLGWQAMLVAAALSALAGGAAAVVLLVGRKAGRRTQMPFGPFLAFGVIAGLLYGQEIAAWYASLLH